MKIWKKCIAVTAILMCVLCQFSMPVQAASIEQNGLEVVLDTNKEEYGEGETIEATLTVVNHQDVKVDHVKLEHLIPKGYKLDKDVTAVKEVKELKPNEKIELKVFYTKEVKGITNDEIGTGDNSKRNILVTICILSGVVIIGIVLVKKKKTKYISVILCFALGASAIPYLPVKANGTNKIIEIQKEVKVKENKLILQAKVTYLSAQKDNYVLTFDSNGGSKIEPISVKAGESVLPPNVPTLKDNMFIGWFEEKNPEDLKKPFDFNKPVNEDKYLYAQWMNNVIDTDKDKIPDDFENYIKSDPTLKDSDGDGLDDYIEVMDFHYSPISKDTDKDSVLDGDEDFDEDGLTNLYELKNGTDPILKDTDKDGLSDYEEIKTYKTKPNNEDTDGDKASDGDEIKAGTDPLVFNEKFVAKKEYGKVSDRNPISLQVEAEVEGEQLGTLSIEPAPVSKNELLSPTIPGYLGYAYDIQLEDQPKKATLTFLYDESLGTIGEDFQPRIYYYNEETEELEELENQKVENGKISASVTHFSTYILLNKVDFDKVWEQEIKAPDYNNENNKKGLDVVLAIDSSGSMSWNDNKNLRLEAAKLFVEKLNKDDRASVVDFDSYIQTYTKLTNDKESLNNAIKAIDSYGGTNLGIPVNKGIELLSDESCAKKYKYIILLTDGEGSYNNIFTQQAKEKDIQIYTIGLGNSVDSNLLKRIAEETGGKYYFASEADDLLGIYDDAAGETIDYVTDSNKDGISDYYNDLIRDGKLTLSTGSKSFVGIDFNLNEDNNPSDDYDNDGLKNGEEIKVIKNGNRVYFKMVSDPTDKNSDHDKYNDLYEINQSMNPLRTNVYKDGVVYPINNNNFTYYDLWEDENSPINKLSRDFWSTININLSHVDEAKLLISTFFKENYAATGIHEESDSIEVEVVKNMTEEILGIVVDLFEKGKLSKEIYDNSLKMLKDIKKALNSAKNLNKKTISEIKGVIHLLEYRYSIRAISKEDMVSGGIDFALDEVEDIGTLIESYANIVSTQQAFIDNEEVLDLIIGRRKDFDRYVQAAAEEIKEAVHGSFIEYAGQITKQLASQTLENIISFGIGLASTKNPYVLVISTIVSIGNLLGASDITESVYCIYVINDLTYSYNKLFSYNVSEHGYYEVDDDKRDYMVKLIKARIKGGKYAKEMVKRQIFDIWDNKTARKELMDAISSESSLVKNMIPYYQYN